MEADTQVILASVASLVWVFHSYFGRSYGAAVWAMALLTYMIKTRFVRYSTDRLKLKHLMTLF